jgi:hypothetical protein
MTAREGGAPKRNRRLIYLGSAVVLVVLVIWGLVAFHSTVVNASADRKASQLQSRLEQAGLPAPGNRVIADTLGSSGGLICQNPSSPLVKARYQAAISNGADGPGSRPVIGDRDVTDAVTLAISIYCPDRLSAWITQVRGLKLEDTTN